MIVVDAGEDVRSLERSIASVDAPADKSDDGDNFRVVVRIRPPLPRELHGDRPFLPNVRVQRSPDEEFGRAVTITEHLEGEDGSRGVISSQTFTFDTVYDQHSSQKTVYCHTAHEAVLSILQGYNATIIAYGQTGTGKTYTMEGFTGDSHRGVIPRATEEVFAYIQHCPNPNTRFLVRASYLQIYNEVISDLIKPQGSAKLLIREDRHRGMFVEGLSEWIVRSPQDVFDLIDEGGKLRMTGSTRMSEMSSRSHAIFTIVCEQAEEEEDAEGGRGPVRVGKLNFVDLAGSEKVRQTGATGQRLEESKKINLSLSALGNVISALTDPRTRHHVPYRDSKLTRILEDSLGGNCRTTMIAMVSPAMDSYYESLSTLKFASRAKCVRNKAVINEDLDQKMELRRYEREVRQLRAALAEATRDAAECRRQLECQEHGDCGRGDRKLGAMGLATAPGGDAESDVDLSTNGSIVGCTQSKLSAVPLSHAEVAWYEQLLVKQRDIMVALTERLAERDEAVAQLEAEVDAYDTALWGAEQALAAKAAEPLVAAAISQEEARAERLSDPLRQQVHALCCSLVAQCPPSAGEGTAAGSTPEHERQVVQQLLEERVEGIVCAELTRRSARNGADGGGACCRCEPVQEWLRAEEHQMGSRGRPNTDTDECEMRVKALLITEAEQIKRPYLAHIAALDTKLQAAEEERASLLTQMETLVGRVHKLEGEQGCPPHGPCKNNTELEQAAQLVEHLQQERHALRTILNDKVRRRVDTACRLLKESSVGAPEAQRKVEEQLKGLQVLLSATLRAMADNP